MNVHYDRLKLFFGDNMCLLYTDTDSLKLFIKNMNPYEVDPKLKNYIDTSNFFFFYDYKFTVENKKTKKDIHQASRHLRMPGTNLKTIKFNNI